MGEGLTNGTGHIQILGKNDYQVKQEGGPIVNGSHLKLGYSWIFSRPPHVILYEERYPLRPGVLDYRGYPLLLGPDFPLPVAGLGSEDDPVDGFPGNPEIVLAVQSPSSAP